MAVGLTLVRTSFLSSSSLIPPSLPNPLLSRHSPSSSLLPPLALLSPSLLPRFSSNGGEVREGKGVTHMTSSVSLLRGLQGQEVYLVGTHFSEESANLVEEVITTVKPDNVFVELCEKRAQQLASGSHLQNYDAFQSASWIEDMLKKMGHVVPDSAFKIMQAYTQAVGLVPGDGYKRAIRIAEEMRENSSQSKPEIIYGDIDGDVTLSKIGDAVSITALFKMVNSAKTLDKSSFMADPVCIELAQKLQDQHTSVEKKMEVLKKREYVRVFTRICAMIFPAGAQALIHDRDVFMCDGLLDLKNQTTVALVGMAHMDGIEEEWKDRSGMS